MATQDEFLKKLRATFRVEAGEHLQTISKGLLELEKTGASLDTAPEAQQQQIEQVFRAAHSLKGAARAVDFTEVESLCQLLEDVFAGWKKYKQASPVQMNDTLHQALDVINSILGGASSNNQQDDMASLRLSLRQLASSVPGMPAAFPASGQTILNPAAKTIKSAARKVSADTDIRTETDSLVLERQLSEETVRVAVAKLEARLLESEEMLMVKLITEQRATDLHELMRRFEGWRNEWATVEQDLRRLRQLGQRIPQQTERRSTAGLERLLDFFNWSADYLKLLEIKTSTLEQVAKQDCHAVGKLVDDLLEDSKKLLLLPFSSISAALPKLVRDLCRDQGKEASLVIHGEDIEIDKRILEEIKDPLVHLLRNCVDHGIEPPAARVANGKPARATIKLAVSHINGNKVQLLLSDDGAGINCEKVKASAIKLGLVLQGEAARLEDTEIHALIFQSAVTTSPMVTELSGRGLGLAIVREKALKLGGEVSVQSRDGLGTDFSIIVPAMRATFRGILVEAGGHVFVIPTTQVERVGRATLNDIQTVEGRETINFAGRVLALVLLKDVLKLPVIEQKNLPETDIQFIVLGKGEQRIAFVVDKVMDEQEVLVKPLRKPLSRVRNIAAATVLGSGQVAPILNVDDLLKSARINDGNVSRLPVETLSGKAASGEAISEARTILVVEDSITSRMLLKGILESVGYKVKTAVDGMEGLTLLRTEKFDLVVSDVEMPRLNGFDLTARIRADKKLESMPVILVTALEKREDREHGIDVGASAYLVKSSLDQSNLLEAVQRLI